MKHNYDVIVDDLKPEDHPWHKHDHYFTTLHDIQTSTINYVNKGFSHLYTQNQKSYLWIGMIETSKCSLGSHSMWWQFEVKMIFLALKIKTMER